MKIAQAHIIRLILLFASLLFLQPAFSDKNRYFPRPEIFRHIILILESRYVDKAKIIPLKMLSSVLERVSIEVNPFMFQLDEETNRLEIQLNKAKYTYEIPNKFNLNNLRVLLEEISLFIKQNYDEIPFGDIDVFMTEGLISTLDPHTVYFGLDDFDQFVKNTSGSYQGVGMVISLKEDKIKVERIFERSPAKKAGLKKGDILTSVNGKSTEGLTTREVSELLIGKEDTALDIAINRKIKNKLQSLKFKVIRKKIELSSIETNIFESKDGRVGYVKITGFQENTYRDLNNSLDEMNIDLKDFKGIILDLRNNPGGYLEQAISVSNKFLTEGMIVYVATVNNEIRKFHEATVYNTIEDIPLIVIIDENSASAAEIVAAALKKNNRAVVIGRKTFGKGSVQDVFSLPDGSAIKVTDSKYLTPEKISIQSQGVQPHILINYLRNDDNSFFSSIIRQQISESALENNFTEWGNESEKPDFMFEYEKSKVSDSLQQQENADDGVVDLPENAISTDYEIDFSREVLMTYSGKYTFQSLYQHAIEFGKSEKNKQQKIIKSNFVDIGVEWDVDDKSAAKHDISLNTAKSENFSGDEFVFESGKSFFIRINVSNNTINKLPPVYVVLTGKNLPFKQKHFAVGNINPGKHKKITVPINISSTVPSLPVPLTAIMYDITGKKISEKTRKLLVINHNPEPLFKIKLDALTLNKSKNSQTKWQKNINLAVQVENVTDNSSDDGVFYFGEQKGKYGILKKVPSSINNEHSHVPNRYEYELELTRKPANKFVEVPYYLKDLQLLKHPIRNLFTIPYEQAEYTYENTQPLVVMLGKEKFNYLVDKKLVSLHFEVIDDDLWKEITVFYNSKKIYHEKNELNKKKREVFLDNISLKTNDFNTFQILVRDSRHLTASYEYTLLQKSY